VNTQSILQQCSKQRLLQTNVRALDLGPLTRANVENVQPTGVIRRLSDGTPVLELKSRALGAPLSRRELEEAVRGSDDTTLFAVFGLGCGHLVRAIRRTTRAPVIVYEPDLGLLRTVLEAGPLDLGDVTIVSSLSDLASVWGRYAGQRRNAVLVNTPGYVAAFQEQSVAVTEAIRRLVERVAITQNTYRRRGKVWVDDVLENIELLAENPPALALENQFKGVPAFVIGAGPSLDKNIALVAEAARKGLVFASNSSALALGKHGIVPQFLVCIESIDISERLLTIPFLDQTIRMFSLSASPKTLRTGEGPLLPFYEAIPQYCLPLEELTGVPGIGVCGSVSTAAFSIAQKLGCGPITLIGQDMAFTSGRTYAGGTGYESSRAEFDQERKHVRLAWNDEIKRLHGKQHGDRHAVEPLLEVPAWGGGTVHSGPSFTAINSWLEASVAMAKQINPGARFINATEGGASVVGFEELSLAALLESLPETNITQAMIMSKARSSGFLKSLQEIREWVVVQSQLTRSTRRRAHRTNRLGRHALSAIRADEPGKITRAFGALDAAELQLKEAVQRAPLIDAWSHAEVDELLARRDAATSAGPSDARSKAQSAITLGTSVAEAIESASLELENTLNNLASRLAEHRSTTKRSLQCL
jgi:hypothetical protein